MAKFIQVQSSTEHYTWQHKRLRQLLRQRRNDQIPDAKRRRTQTGFDALHRRRAAQKKAESDEPVYAGRAC